MSNLSSLKPITLRLPEEDLSFVNHEAEKLGITAGVYLRILVKESLNSKRTGASHQVSILRTLQTNLTQEVERQGLDEQDILKSAKQARKEIAEQELQQWGKIH